MDQLPLLYDDEFHALRAMIEGGRGYKATAAHLWPAMKPESAYARLKACTNPGRDEKLSFGEIIQAAKFNERFDALYYFCAETLHAQPVHVAPDDAMAKLADQLSAHLQDGKRMFDRLQELSRIAQQPVQPGLRRAGQ
jgi:hypothetical protein